VIPLLLSAALAADDGTKVLVSGLQPRNPESVGLASLVENFLAQELDKHPAIDVVRVEDTPDFLDYPARTYIEGCPPGEIAGCTFVVAERGGAELAVTGSVKTLVSGTKITIEILDIANARTLISFQSELEAGSDEEFAEGVAKVLVAAISGELGEKDIRFQEDGEEGPEPIDDEAVARQLAELTREMGGVTASISRSDTAIKKTTYTLEDLAEKMEGEGTKPWERLGMKPTEYLRYKNSGLQLFEWRQRALGRHGQLLVRAYGGFASGPYNGTYYGRLAYDTITGSLAVVDAYSAQAVQTGSGALVGASVAYGLTPVLDVGVTGGLALGTFTVDINQETVGQPAVSPDPQITGQTTWLVGPRVTATLFPISRFRPAFGGSVLVMGGRTILDAESVPDSLTTFNPAFMVAGEVFVGGEARISDRVDILLQVPVQVRLAGAVSASVREGLTEVVDATPPPEASVIGAGAVVGLQVRLFGKKAEESTRYDELEEIEE
jgi:hypothetical protein